MDKVLNKNVGIVGCGWLGKALTKKLITNGHSVIASTQHKEKISDLLALGAQVDCFSLSSAPPTEGDFKLSLFKQPCLIIAIPPGIRQGHKNYPDKMKNIVELAQAGDVQQLIMISSTAVYNDLNGDIDECAELDLSSEKSNIIHQAEIETLKFSGATIILRLSGLVGPARHPGKFLRNGRLLSEPEATTNLIHQQDAVELLYGLINKPEHTSIYNGSSRTNVRKCEYYGKAAKVLGLPKPEFKESMDEIPKSNKVINSTKIRNLLGYTFQYDDLLLWLEQG